ncbi:phosphotransferase system, mannose/fructose-specific component IIA [Vibrio vulnificus YJ016]|uniref:PTS mannose transporter subunit IIA n=3 Tax=Vibrio TaxID=662 RepID=A0A3N3DQI0_9VIBR|nr:MULTISPECIES: PTS galactosamine/N-acetylgalactosamine transporter subunit IIA [Vibrio]ELM6648803.1 PTS mannose transporter subunit IIA [Vibrio vulnificus]MCG6285433.1 PTS sugar transporter subunit IIA [Vibrio vulnificus]OLQ90116.1 PTS mannose transporter subunit IIA [Vibrio panuliri]OLQ94164.1 PTS mannose transporter subunit IIA [Vibrio ponticus]PWY34336.1 PTS mannose transporter subunit IIA [Vibrio vulnificus]
MIGIIVSGHINFATGMQSAVEAIVGEQDSLEFIDFVPTMTTEQLEEQMLSSIEKMNDGSGVLILTDVPGGSPCNRGVAIMLNRSDVKVVAGCNLPMITNACFERDGVSLAELTEIVCEIGAQSMKDMAKEIAMLENNNSDSFEDEL